MNICLFFILLASGVGYPGLDTWQDLKPLVSDLTSPVQFYRGEKNLGTVIRGSRLIPQTLKSRTPFQVLSMRITILAEALKADGTALTWAYQVRSLKPEVLKAVQSQSAPGVFDLTAETLLDRKNAEIKFYSPESLPNPKDFYLLRFQTVTFFDVLDSSGKNIQLQILEEEKRLAGVLKDYQFKRAFSLGLE